MHSSSSSDDSKPTSKSTNTVDSCMKLVVIGLPLSIISPSSLLFFKSTPLPTTHSHFNNKPILNLQNITESSQSLIRNLHNSIDKCLGLLLHFAYNNPLFTKLDDLSSEYRKFCQINRRTHGKLTHLPRHNFAAIIPGDSMAGLVVSNGILNFLNIYNTLLVVRLVLTWFPNTPPAIVSPLSTLCDPYLNIFRGVIPPLGGTLDLSPILAFLVLNALTSTASALPAELPPPKSPSSETGPGPSFLTAISRLTTSQKKWLRRFDANRSKGSSVDE